MTRNDPDLYDVDFFTWTQRQTAALPAMSQDASVDAEHLAEEFADLGRSELHRVASLLVLVLQHLVKLHVAPTSRDAAHCY